MLYYFYKINNNVIITIIRVYNLIYIVYILYMGYEVNGLHFDCKS
jgi:hypothetical protein